jgi:hypothetical protein
MLNVMMLSIVMLNVGEQFYCISIEYLLTIKTRDTTRHCIPLPRQIFAHCEALPL